MGLFDTLFGGGYDKAAQAEVQGLTNAYNTATPLYGQARQNITDYGAAALSPWTNVFNTGTQGLNTYGAAVGAGGGADAGPTMLNTLRSLPGYQFALDTGTTAIDRGAASRSGGSLYSGNTLNAEQAFGQGLANQNWQQYVSALAPYFNLTTAGAQGVSGVNTGIGSNLAGINLNQGNLGYNTQAGIGNAIGAGDIASQNAQNTFVNGLVQAGGKVLGYMAA